MREYAVAHVGRHGCAMLKRGRMCDQLGERGGGLEGQVDDMCMSCVCDVRWIVDNVCCLIDRRGGCDAALGEAEAGEAS